MLQNNNLFLGSGYFAIDCNYLWRPFCHHYPFVFKLPYILQFWHCCGVVDSAAALKCNGYCLDSLLAVHFSKVSVHCRGGPGM